MDHLFLCFFFISNFLSIWWATLWQCNLVCYQLVHGFCVFSMKLGFLRIAWHFLVILLFLASLLQVRMNLWTQMTLQVAAHVCDLLQFRISHTQSPTWLQFQQQTLGKSLGTDIHHLDGSINWYINLTLCSDYPASCTSHFQAPTGLILVKH